MEAAGPLQQEIPVEGHLGHLTAAEQNILDQFKAYVKDTLKNNDPKWDDWYLLRFLRARKFDMEKTKAMFSDFLKWRVERNVDTSIKKDFSKLEEFSKENWIHNYYGVSRDGYPVYIESYAKTDCDAILKNFTSEDIQEYFVNSCEVMIHCIWPELSRNAGRRIDRMITILDIKGFGIMRAMKSDTRAFLNMTVSCYQNYYPECSGKMFIVNTGYTFSALWAIVKLWVDEKTRKKIVVLGSKFQKDLLKYIDASQLPESLGGTNPTPIMDATGPWTAYALECTNKKTFYADGVEQGDPWKEDARAKVGWKSG